MFENLQPFVSAIWQPRIARQSVISGLLKTLFPGRTGTLPKRQPSIEQSRHSNLSKIGPFIWQLPANKVKD